MILYWVIIYVLEYHFAAVKSWNESNKPSQPKMNTGILDWIQLYFHHCHFKCPLAQGLGLKFRFKIGFEVRILGPGSKIDVLGLGLKFGLEFQVQFWV